MVPKEEGTAIKQPLTVGAALEWAIETLKGAGVPEPETDAQWLLSEVIALPRSLLFLERYRCLSTAQMKTFVGFIRQRQARKPLAYLLKRSFFCGLELFVDERVMIPRQETEILVEEVVKFLAGKAQPKIADIGTGSGAIACAIAHLIPDAVVWATDVSTAALTVAQENVQRLGYTDRIHLLSCDLAEGLSQALQGERLDAIVANLPYIADDEWTLLPPEVKDHEPALALKGGPDGLAVVRRLLSQPTQQYLKPDGFLALEIGFSQVSPVKKLLTEAKWALEKIQKDWSGHERVVIARPSDLEC
ncbi:MAG: peptide chain release factor N(5)-glutamine methyltransferase [Armatimonadota bacterium]|nr:peptide chain release factor N(5)-glutamine methyltransferase [Armatimonadota bacterium]